MTDLAYDYNTAPTDPSHGGKMTAEQASDKIAALRDVLEEVDAALDKQVYGLNRSDTTPWLMRNDGVDLPPDYEHDVLITEALWDRIRRAIA